MATRRARHGTAPVRARSRRRRRRGANRRPDRRRRLRRVLGVAGLPLISILARDGRRRLRHLVLGVARPGPRVRYRPAGRRLRSLIEGSVGSFGAIVQTLGAVDSAHPRRAVGRAWLQGRPLRHRGSGPVPDGRSRCGRWASIVADEPTGHRHPASRSRPGSAFGPSGGSSRASSRPLSGAHEVVTTIMLNYVAISVLAWAVSGPLKVRGLALAASPTTSATPPCRSSSGDTRPPRHRHRVRMVARRLRGCCSGRRSGSRSGPSGANPDAARYAGMRPRTLIVLTMSLCGLLAGPRPAPITVLGVTRNMTSVVRDDRRFRLDRRGPPCPLEPVRHHLRGAPVRGDAHRARH